MDDDFRFLQKPGGVQILNQGIDLIVCTGQLLVICFPAFLFAVDFDDALIRGIGQPFFRRFPQAAVFIVDIRIMRQVQVGEKDVFSPSLQNIVMQAFQHVGLSDRQGKRERIPQKRHVFQGNLMFRHLVPKGGNQRFAKGERMQEVPCQKHQTGSRRQVRVIKRSERRRIRQASAGFVLSGALAEIKGIRLVDVQRVAFFLQPLEKIVALDENLGIFRADVITGVIAAEQRIVHLVQRRIQDAAHAAVPIREEDIGMREERETVRLEKIVNEIGNFISLRRIGGNFAFLFLPFFKGIAVTDMISQNQIDDIIRFTVLNGGSRGKLPLCDFGDFLFRRRVQKDEQSAHHGQGQKGHRPAAQHFHAKEKGDADRRPDDHVSASRDRTQNGIRQKAQHVRKIFADIIRVKQAKNVGGARAGDDAEEHARQKGRERKNEKRQERKHEQRAKDNQDFGQDFVVQNQRVFVLVQEQQKRKGRQEEHEQGGMQEKGDRSLVLRRGDGFAALFTAFSSFRFRFVLDFFGSRHLELFPKQTKFSIYS